MLSTAILVASLVAVSQAQSDGTTTVAPTRQEGTTTTSRQEIGATTTTSRQEIGATTTTVRQEGTTTVPPKDGTTTTARQEGTTTTSKVPTITTTKEGGIATTTVRQEGTTTARQEGTTTARPDGTTTARPEGTTTTAKIPTITTTKEGGIATTTSRQEGGITTTTSRQEGGITTTTRKEEPGVTTTTGRIATTTGRDGNVGTTTTRKEEPGVTTTIRIGDGTTRASEITKETTRAVDGTTRGTEYTKETTRPVIDGTTRGTEYTKETTRPVIDGTTRGGDYTKETTRPIGDGTTRGEGTKPTTRPIGDGTTRGEGTKPTTRPIGDLTRPPVDEKREDFRAAADEAAKCRIDGSANCDSDFDQARQELIDAAKKANVERSAVRAADRTRVEDLARDLNTKAPDVICKTFTDVAAACSKECDFTGGDDNKTARFDAALKCVSGDKEKVLREAGADASKETKDQARTDLKTALQSGLALLPEKQRQDAQKTIDDSSVAEEKRTEREVTLIEINAKVSRAKETVDNKDSTPAARSEARKTLQEANADAAKKAAVDRLPGNRPNVCSKLLDGAASDKATKAGESDKSKFIGSVCVLHVKIDVPEDKVDWVRTEARKINANAEVEKSDSELLTKTTDGKATVDTKSKKKRGTASCEVFVPADVADYDIASTKVSTIVAESGGSVTGVSSIGQADVEAAKTVTVEQEEDVVDGAAALAMSAVMAVVSIVVALV